MAETSRRPSDQPSSRMARSDRHLCRRRQPVERTEPCSDDEVEHAIPAVEDRAAHGQYECGLPVGVARIDMIARLIRFNTYCPSISRRSSIKILKAGGFKLGVGAVLADQQVRGPPNVEFGNHALFDSISTR